MPRPRPPHRAHGLLACKCGKTITSGHLAGNEILCDECWDKRQLLDEINFPGWRGNDARPKPGGVS